MDITSLIVQLISGAVGGNAAGAMLKQFSLGTVGNSLVGILGGGIGGQLLALMGAGGAGAAAASASGLDIGSIVTNVLGGGVGGGVLMTIVGLIRKQLAKT
jgi:hypothetical protein